MFNIAVMVSGSGSNLQAIIDNVKSGNIKANIALVISDNENAYALERAKQNNINTAFIKNDTNLIIESLKKNNIDLIILAGYLSILEEKLVQIYENRIINIHPSLIPKYCGKGYYGLNVHKAVIENNEKFSGATVHYVDSGIDTGDIIIQEKLEIGNYDTAITLQKRVLEIEHKILPIAINLVLKEIGGRDESHN